MMVDYLYANFCRMSEFRPTRFEILPLIIKNLLIINGLVFFAQFTFERMGSKWMENTFALHDVHSDFFRPYQLITHLFMHGTFGHIFFNMFALWMFGSALENIWGAKRFLLFYMLCGLGAASLHLATLYFEYKPYWEMYPMLLPEDQAFLHYNYTVGASGAVFGCLAAFGYLFPNSLIYVYFLVPLKAKWFVLIYAGMELWLGVRNSAGDNVAHWAHLGGALVGFLLVLYWNKTNRRRFY
jgi:membrane associated rhomboid family serine protease